MNLELETSNVVAMNAFRSQALLSDIDDPLEALLREANIPDGMDGEDQEFDAAATTPGLDALALLNMSEDELKLHLENRIAGLREGISRLKFYLTDVHEAINGL
jgi:hypothetical protein